MSDLKKIRDVRSQIGQPDRLKPIIIGCPTLQRRGKPCPIWKKVGEKGENGMSDLETKKDSSQVRWPIKKLPLQPAIFYTPRRNFNFVVRDFVNHQENRNENYPDLSLT